MPAMVDKSVKCGNDPFGLFGGAAVQLPDFSTPAVSVDAAGARPGDFCFDCGCPLVVRGIAYECPQCCAVHEAADINDIIPPPPSESPGAGAMRGRLRVVGKESGWYQPDLDRTNPGESSETQKRSTYQELLRLNREYESRGGNPFPLDILQIVTENYHLIQQLAVKRSMMKKAILAALAFHACIDNGFTRSRAEAAELLQLPTHGIARGDDYLRSVDEDHGLEININTCRLRPHITSALAQLDITENTTTLGTIVAEIVDFAEKGFIGCRSILRSKVIATIYVVLRRSGTAPALSIEDVSARCEIRRHTMIRFIGDLNSYHSRFEPIYKKHGISAEQWR